ACSPDEGWLITSSSRSTPRLSAYEMSSACSTSRYAALSPWLWTLATACKHNELFPPDSAPYTSVILPRGQPPTPRILSSRMLPVGMTSHFTGPPSRDMMASSPYLARIASSTERVGASFFLALAIRGVSTQPLWESG